MERNVTPNGSDAPPPVASRVVRLSPISTFRRRRTPEKPRRSQSGSARHQAQPVCKAPILIPEGFPTIFRPTAEMGLNLVECKMTAYIFGHFDRIGELLFKNGTFNMTRSAFFSVCPGEQLNPNVVRAFSLLATEAERTRETVRAWFLPCSFATHVWAGAPLSDLDAAYAIPYMPATKTLRHVFLPAAEADGSYYLVLIDLKDRVIYSMDVCWSAETILQREAVIEKLRNAIGTILLLERHNKGFTSCWIPEPANFGDVIYPEGIPDDLHSDQTAAWLLYWLQQHGGFSARIFRPITKVWFSHASIVRMKLYSLTQEYEKTIRMKSAIKLLTSTSNELFPILEDRIERAWAEMLGDEV
ncbi:hypothetical protein PIB30_000371 [Stylosanthes scabra]|uniref:Uncharacterized protein n=1 Tax=Stylosanthes scabra TaxID=79078 RepID=A0ABU6U175_9FABA|nr:hypothetical protein [Stylosanthes scabra]